MTVLDNRTLNRSLMARQLLLGRHPRTVGDALTHLVGLQAQEPQEPYVGLWSRLAGFQPGDLSELLESRAAVRTLLMRRTLHLVTAADCLRLRTLHQPMLEARVVAVLRRDLAGVDLAELAAAGRPHFEAAPSTLPEVGRAVGDRWPGVPARVLGDALSSLVPLVQVPPRGLWGQAGPARNTTISRWLGRPPSPVSDEVADDLVLRYLAAFGPAASSDLRAWCGLTGLREPVKRLRPRLRSFRDARGRELLDVPDGPLPDPSTPAPPRFLPAFDNVVLGFDDRSRVIDDQFRRLSVEGARFLLVDGRVAGVWTIGPTGLRVTMLTRQAPAEIDAVAAEGEALLAWHTGGATTGVEIVPA
jgi:hypothetical protein